MAERWDSGTEGQWEGIVGRRGMTGHTGQRRDVIERRGEGPARRGGRSLHGRQADGHAT